MVATVFVYRYMTPPVLPQDVDENSDSYSNLARLSPPCEPCFRPEWACFT